MARGLYFIIPLLISTYNKISYLFRRGFSVVGAFRNTIIQRFDHFRDYEVAEYYAKDYG